MEKSCLLFKPKVLHITIAKDIYSNDSITIGAIKSYKLYSGMI